MSDDKLKLVLGEIRLENNDNEALIYAEHEWAKRNPTQGNVVNLAEQLKSLDQERLELSRTALTEQLKQTFKNLDIHTVSWGQKTTPYNDEGMYDGVSGPVFNLPEDLEEHERLDQICYHSPPQPEFKKEWDALHGVLEAIGAETLCRIEGDDEYIVTATREKPVYDFKLTSEYCGY